MRIAELLPSTPSPLWRLVAQAGVKHAVGLINFTPVDAPVQHKSQPWSRDSLMRVMDRYQEGGFTLSAVETRPPMERIKLGLPGKEEEIDIVCELVRNLGRLGVPVWCYEWMPIFNWTRTAVDIPGRGGALVTGFDAEKAAGLSLPPQAPVREETLWETLQSFLRVVVPVAEEAGVRLAMHPDDPPISPLRGCGRIMRSIDNYERLLELVPSSANAIALCQGNFALMTHDLPAVIRRFGERNAIAFVHFRDVRGTRERFVETFHDNGQTDMYKCIQAYRDAGYHGVCRPDHVPTMEGDENDNPGYSSVGRLFAVGYLRGLLEAATKEGGAPLPAGDSA